MVFCVWGLPKVRVFFLDVAISRGFFGVNLQTDSDAGRLSVPTVWVGERHPSPLTADRCLLCRPFESYFSWDYICVVETCLILFGRIDIWELRILIDVWMCMNMYPLSSMYGIFTIYLRTFTIKNLPNAGKYKPYMDRSYGYGLRVKKFMEVVLETDQSA